jgi:sugar O-acyltransferase (sialic acid O-acetyltransferase NeuD family)
LGLPSFQADDGGALQPSGGESISQRAPEADPAARKDDGRALEVVLFGIGSSIVVEYVETCRRLGWLVRAAVRNRDGDVYFKDPSRISDSRAVDSTIVAYPCFCPLFTPANRAVASREAENLGFRFAMALIDPHAIVAATTRVGGGSFVNAGCVVGAEGSIGRQVLVNRSVSIGHHVEIGAFASIGPGAIVGGMAMIGPGTIIGAGAIVLPKVKVGEFAVVGAGALVTHDVPARAKVVGHPAQIIEKDLADFVLPDIGV